MKKIIKFSPLVIDGCHSCPFQSVDFVRYGWLNLKEKDYFYCIKLKQVYGVTNKYTLSSIETPQNGFHALCPLTNYPEKD